ncbi:hypothetical protein [Streptomyces sp. NPDC059015]|uniref:hypothetical protein n=1 Tax=unclassified Streptomyces TaxID=2593676 RepID=UPI0036763769
MRPHPLGDDSRGVRDSEDAGGLAIATEGEHRVLAKLGITGRGEAAALAHRLRLFPAAA